MTAFNVEVTVTNINLQAPSQEDLDNGARPEIGLICQVGMLLPIADENQQPIVSPLGVIRFAMTGDNAQELGERLVEEGGKLPVKPAKQVEVASSLASVQQNADFMRGLRGDVQP